MCPLSHVSHENTGLHSWDMAEPGLKPRAPIRLSSLRQQIVLVQLTKRLERVKLLKVQQALSHLLAFAGQQ